MRTRFPLEISTMRLPSLIYVYYLIDRYCLRDSEIWVRFWNNYLLIRFLLRDHIRFIELSYASHQCAISRFRSA